jgi:hypothetical protein
MGPEANGLVIWLLTVPVTLKITCRNGASITNETRENTADRILKKKYKLTKAG